MSTPSPRVQNVRQSLQWRLLDFVYRLFEGDDEWAERRFGLIVLMVLALVLMGRATEQIAMPEVLQPTLDAMPELIRVIFSFGLSLMHGQTLRHILPPVIGCILAVRLASNYVRDLFELPDFSMGRRYLTAAMFGIDYPEIRIGANGYDVEGSKDKDANPIPKIGGPGFVSVGTGYVAVFERVGGPSKVAGAGKHFIRRFETLREVLDLRDQLRKRDGIKVFTKDGIQVTLRNIEVAFRVHTHSQPRTEKEIYPFSIGAARRLVYNKTVGVNGPVPWTDSVTGAIVGRIIGFVASNVLDDVIAKSTPDAPDPRDKVKAIFADRKTRETYLKMGFDILWVSMGHIEAPRDVIDERLRAWGSWWQKQVNVQKASGEAEKIQLMEYARGLARIEEIEKITKNLPVSPDDPISVDFVILQLAQVLSSTGHSHLLSTNEYQSELMRYVFENDERRRRTQEDDDLPLLPSV